MHPSRESCCAALAFAFALAFVAHPAHAHLNTIAFGDLRLGPERVALDLYVAHRDWDPVVPLDADADELLTAGEVRAKAAALAVYLHGGVMAFDGDGERCALDVGAPELMSRQGEPYVKSPLTFDCGGGATRAFTLRYTLFATEHPGHRLFLRVDESGDVRSEVVVTSPQRPASVTLRLKGPPPGFADTVARFLPLGVEHIFLGFDHVLFLLALIAVGGSLWFLVKIVTAFTVAHSVTLALATLGVVTLPGRPVEIVIALSIAVVAAENLLFAERFVAWRVLVTFAFGLVHGFGFAGVLAEMDIGRGQTAAALVSFNAGVELGQAAIVAALYPGLRWLHRQPWRGRAVRGLSAGVLVMGLYWLIERSFYGA